MQLFTIGLYEMNPDGSQQLDMNGQPVDTYDTEDVKEFSRCWTGFSLRPMRKNLLIEGHSYGNRVDPMRLRGTGSDTKRDLFPKSNLVCQSHH